MEEKFIVKVQLSVKTNQAKQMVLIYNEDRTVTYELPSDKDFDSLMGDKFKAFFYATLDKEGLIHIGDEASKQEW